MENLNDRKLKIIQDIIKLNDTNLLSEIEDLVVKFQIRENENSVKEMPTLYHSKLHLTKNQKKMLQEADDEIEKGNFTNHEDVQKMTAEWLK